MGKKCDKCGVQLQGNAQYCIACYASLHVPCGDCMVRGASGKLRTLRDRYTRKPVDCATCRNERFVLLKPEKS